MTFLDIGDEHFIVVEQVISVKKIDKDKCSLWLTGQAAQDGFVVEKGAKELVEEICAAYCEDEPQEDDEDDQDDE
jgi:hypothetical protein